MIRKWGKGTTILSCIGKRNLFLHINRFTFRLTPRQLQFQDDFVAACSLPELFNSFIVGLQSVNAKGVSNFVNKGIRGCDMPLLVPKPPDADQTLSWLNDGIVDYFMAKFEIRDIGLSARTQSRKRSMFFSSLFMALIQRPPDDTSKDPEFVSVTSSPDPTEKCEPLLPHKQSSWLSPVHFRPILCLNLSSHVLLFAIPGYSQSALSTSTVSIDLSSPMQSGDQGEPTTGHSLKLSLSMSLALL